MPSLLDRVSRACVPLSALPILAGLRAHENLRGTILGDRLWLRWPEGDEEVVRHVHSIQGGELFLHDEGKWYRPGRRLPELSLPPDEEGLPLHALVAPAACQPLAPASSPLSPVPLRLVRSDRPRSPTAMMADRDVLHSWADRVTSWQLNQLQAAWCGDRILFRGEPLPALPRCTRYAGTSVLVPLGYRVEPEWTETALKQVLGLEPGACALLGAEVEIIDAAAFGPLTRAGLRRRLLGSP